MKVISLLLRQSIQSLKSTSNTPQKGFIKGAFGKYLLVTNTVTAGVLMGIADFCQQHIERYYYKPLKPQYDVQRTVNMTVVAFGHGFYHHYFYGWMDKIMPVNSLRNVCYKILLDQIIASPACMWIFFIGMAVMENRTYGSGWEEMKKKFYFCYMMDWIVWPPGQFINFYYVPSKYRVLYINILTMLYDVFLSYVKFFDQENAPKVKETDI